MRVGTKLLNIREERKLTQTEMANLLDVSPSAYARLERGETSTDIDQLIHFSKKLAIPIQEFLPETITVSNNTNSENAQGLIMSHITYNYHYSDQVLAIVNAHLK